MPGRSFDRQGIDLSRMHCYPSSRSAESRPIPINGVLASGRSVASRIAEELGTVVGRHVGYKIRFTDATSPETHVKLMTDGILLAETQQDRFLDQYDVLWLLFLQKLGIDGLISCK